ncbi:DUF885 domain-containing protein [Microbacterium sp. MPKO10]|uniref:DUF885 domain-containing protein n=1 Tax=Microbacterium sp. MPKO10 TaxID=2989818 RepID=UPI00223613FF|nr:DUF885 domain-containing protein [Microbacterium sp. MPKO10]MCW4459511.1 DUF885 domain-containing protein [Microbacterium sp. MPKO10]
MTPQQKRTPSAIDKIAEDWVDTLVTLEPTVGTYIGRSEANDRFADYSPAGLDSERDALTTARSALRAQRPVDDVDAVTQEDLGRELDLALETLDAGLPLRSLNVIESPSQEIREAFDLMPTDTVDDWSTVSARLSRVPEAIDGYVETLRLGIDQGITPARRQVFEVADQARKVAASDGFFTAFAASASPATGELPSALVADLRERAERAAAAYGRLAGFLTDELAGAATERDAIGRDLYALTSRQFLGATIDLDETYEWGIEELARMVDEQESIARQIVPGVTVLEAIAHLDNDESRKLHGTDALRTWMQATSDKAVAELARSHFDIPDEIKTIECMIAPTQEGGIYYTGPTDDFSRPGRMWWSVPEGVTEFDTWRELTTVYHEGVPGHHLQIGQAVYNRGILNSWRRLLAGTSGHAEGWALYAERLMEQLGYLDDPADRLGMLDGQRMRAARVVLDIGVHLEKQRPDGAGPWTAEYAFDFMSRNVNMNEGFVRFEVNRYLGWPGQAPSYKVGQRIWEQLRDDAAARQGGDFDIKDFHSRALALGGVGLDTLRSALAC